MSRIRFSRALKRSICIEYMQSGKSRKEIALKYDLPSEFTKNVHLCSDKFNNMLNTEDNYENL